MNRSELAGDPWGRSKYGTSISAQGRRISSACTAISVSISNPLESAGKDLTKRRDSAR